jgi:hypothetical protein
MDGPNKGKSIMTRWKWMVQCYYEGMGGEREPSVDTFKTLGLENLIPDLKQVKKRQISVKKWPQNHIQNQTCPDE